LPKRASAVTPYSAIEFTIVDSSGRPVPRGVVSVRIGDNHHDLCSFGNGRARIEPGMVTEQAALEIWAPAHRVTVVTAPFASRRIALEPELEVEFELAVPPLWTANKLTLLGFVWMRDTDPPQFQPIAFDRMQPFEFDSHGRGSIGLPCAGAFSFYLSVRRAIPGEGEDDYGVALVNGEFDVRETDGRQIVKLALDPEGLKQCNEDLGLK
jgi:hypothetical protein